MPINDSNHSSKFTVLVVVVLTKKKTRKKAHKQKRQSVRMRFILIL